MLCTHCGTRLAELPLDVESSKLPSSRAGSLQGLLCTRCGALVRAEDLVDGRLGKLSLLSRFGLGADDRPLLSTKGQD